jgi:hypothetical protein
MSNRLLNGNRKFNGGVALFWGRGPQGLEGTMQWLLRGITTIVLAFSLGSCGDSGFDTSNGGDQLVLQFTGFSAEQIEQADAVFETSADIDVCLGFCTQNIFQSTDLEIEPYGSTRVLANFTNAGKSDILIDEYTVTIPNSGVPPRKATISQRVFGRRCFDGSACASDFDCGEGTCAQSESSFDILLVDLVTKDLARVGECAEIDFVNQVIIPQTVVESTLQINITFSGSDNTGERFNLSAGYSGTFANYDNCEDQ